MGRKISATDAPIKKNSPNVMMGQSGRTIKNNFFMVALFTNSDMAFSFSVSSLDRRRFESTELSLDVDAERLRASSSTKVTWLTRLGRAPFS